MNLLSVAGIELKRKRREFNKRSLLVIIPLIIVFIALLAYAMQSQYSHTVPVYVIETDSAELMALLQGSQFTSSGLEIAPRLTVFEQGGLHIAQERGFVQRSAAQALRHQLRVANVAYLQQHDLSPVVLLNISERFQNFTQEQSNFISISSPTETVEEEEVVVEQRVVIEQIGDADPGDSTEISSSEQRETALFSNQLSRGEEGDYQSVEDLETFGHIRHVFVAISVVIVLNFFAVMYANSLFQEKLNKRSALLFTMPLQTRDILFGKALPYLALSLILISVLLILHGMPMQFYAYAMGVTIVLAGFYFAVAYISAVFARSHREFSFISVFLISLLSLYLIIPAFVANVSPISNASLLTPLVLFAQGITLPLSVITFLVVIYSVVILWLFYIASYLFTYEEFYSNASVTEKIMQMATLYIKKWYHAAIFAFFCVPMGWLLEVLLIMVLLVARVPHMLVVVVLLAAYIEEILRNLAAHAFFRSHAFTWLSAVVISLASGAGFAIAEKSLLFVMIAPFAQGYELLLIGSFIIPIILHGLLTFVFLVLRRYLPLKYYILCLITGLLHAGINLAVLGVLT